MHVRGTLVPLAFLALLAVPRLASAGIVEKWQGITNYAVVSLVNDLDADGNFEMLTIEPSGKIGVRSTATGALVAQTAGVYQPETFWFTYLEPTDQLEEIIFLDHITGNLVCVNYNGSSILPVRWSFAPIVNGAFGGTYFADLDGTGQLYMMFPNGLKQYYIRNNSGVLVSTIDQTAVAPGTGTGWTTAIDVDDFGNDGRQEIMIQYHYGGQIGQDLLHVFGSDAPGPMAPLSGASQASPRPAVHEIDQVNGVWVEAGHTEPEANAARRTVRLP